MPKTVFLFLLLCALKIEAQNCSVMTTIDSTICYRSSVQIGTNVYSIQGSYTVVLPNASYLGCDSIVNLNCKGLVEQIGVFL